MRMIIALFCASAYGQIFPFPGPVVSIASFTYTVVHHKFCSGTDTAQTCTLGFTSSTANSIVILSHQFDNGDATSITFADGHSTAYTRFAAATHANAAYTYAYSYGQWVGKPSAAITTMTPSWTGGAGKNEYYVLEVSGLTPTADVGVAGLSNGSASFTSGNATSTAAATGEIAFCFAVDRFDSTVTITNTGVGTWTQISQDQDSTNVAVAAVWYQTPLASATPACSGTTSSAVSLDLSVGTYK